MNVRAPVTSRHSSESPREATAQAKDALVSPKSGKRMILFEVKGRVIKTSMDTVLAAGQASKLTSLCMHHLLNSTAKSDTQPIIIDRDPEAFMQVINYLRYKKESEGKQMKFEDVFSHHTFVQEMKYWGIPLPTETQDKAIETEGESPKHKGSKT